MKTMKALFSSALALVVILMLSLFTSCSGTESQDLPAPEASLVKTIALEDTDIIEASSDTLPAETLSVKEALKVSSEGISILNATTCTAVDEHLPSGAASEFSKEVGRVYLHTQIKMPKEQSGAIQHVWKRNGKVVSTVDLTVKGPTFRTWSYKTVTEKMTGNWTVDVQTAAGELLETVSFDVN